MIRAKNISEGWEKSIRLLLKEGKWVPSQRNFRTLEICNLQILIEKPLKESQISDKYDFSNEFLENYTLSHERKFKNESVKERLFEYGENKINQIDNIITLIKKDWNTRRAVVSTIVPESDFSSLHPPCVTYLQFMCRDSKLNLFSVLRSNDAWLAALPDMISLAALQLKVANELKLQVGSYSQVSVSYHLYEVDYISAVDKFAS